MKKSLLLAVLFLTTISYSQNNIGSGNCIDFSANINNANHINLGGLDWINLNDFTVECWMKVNSVFDDEAFFSNKDWSSGTNTGIVFDVQDNGNNMKFNFKDNVNPRKDLTVAVQVLNRDWFHFAGTYKRGGYFVVYINGQAKDSLNVSSITSSFAGSYTYKLGQDGTGNYTWNGGNPRYNGKIDELRIWSQVRTAQQIQDNMCHSLMGNEPNLYAYYNFNEVSGATITDLSSNAINGNIVNGVLANRVVSGAPIGNVSVNKYGTSLASQTLALSLSNAGSVTLNNFNAITGVHLYQVNNLPTITNGLNTISGNAGYFGAFVCDTGNLTSFNLKYDYSNFNNAILDETNLILFNRLKNDYSPWTNSGSSQDVNSDNFTNPGITSRREWFLGTTSGLSCQSTDSIYIQSSTPTSATIAWNSNATNWNIVWGVQGFDFNTGQQVTNTTVNPYTFSNLASGVVYEMYVQDTCQGSSSGIWTGPFTFTGQICSSPSQLGAIQITSSSATLTWTNNVPGVSLFSIEWGLQGFPQGVGIPVNNVQSPYLLSGLSPTTSYDYYVKTNCGSSNSSSWAGPFTFTTLSTAGLVENDMNSFISPNPFNDEFTFTYPNIKNEKFAIYDALGKEINYNVVYLNENQLKISVTNVQNLIIFLQVKTTLDSKSYRIVKN
jgi:hypothetical protein